jgi:peptide/nickel transport system ATP-binding protein
LCEHLGSIPGIVPTLIGEMRGCQFASRCPFAMDECRTGDVAPQETGDGRGYRCVLPLKQLKATSRATMGAK